MPPNVTPLPYIAFWYFLHFHTNEKLKGATDKKYGRKMSLGLSVANPAPFSPFTHTEKKKSLLRKYEREPSPDILTTNPTPFFLFTHAKK